MTWRLVRGRGAVATTALAPSTAGLTGNSKRPWTKGQIEDTATVTNSTGSWPEFLKDRRVGVFITHSSQIDALQQRCHQVAGLPPVHYFVTTEVSVAG